MGADGPYFDPRTRLFVSGSSSAPRREGEAHVDSRYYPDCWLARYGRWEGPGDLPPCEGQLRKCHLVAQQFLLKELPAEKSAELVWDPRVWVWGCGGPTGIGGHHGHLDFSKKLRVPRSAIPRELEELMKQLKLDWYLDRTYQRRARTSGVLGRPSKSVPE